MRNPLRFITWALTALFGLCVAPIIGQFFVELAAERGAYKEPTKKLEQAITWLAPITESWWFALALGYLAGTVFALWLVRLFQEKPAIGKADTVAIEQKTPFDSADQDRLLRELKDQASEHTTLKVMVADIKHRPFADKLVSIFHLAGWRATLAETPLETYIHRYHEGIEVKGYNAHFLETIVGLLKQAGLPAIRSRVEELQVPQDNPKWPFAQHTIKITIGHH